MTVIMRAFKSFQTFSISAHIPTACLQNSRSWKCDMKIWFVLDRILGIVNCNSNLSLCNSKEFKCPETVQCRLCWSFLAYETLWGTVEYIWQCFITQPISQVNFRTTNVQVSILWWKSSSDEIMPLSSVRR